ncbi:hypothetical protein QLX08_010165 [Tetragonisca angustula]|uniref:Uncharacterized protein n=1 Tax=Tetragonisca angustula TaxID=166442 RepID=A0AAW0ZD47_9HYME
MASTSASTEITTSVGFLTRGTTCTYMPIASPSLTPLLVLWIYTFSETIVPWLRRAEHSPSAVRALDPIVAAPFAEIQTKYLGTLAGDRI